MAERLDGTVALVTGASSGMGAATARLLAAQGAGDALAARRVELLRQLVDEITGRSGRALLIEADVTDKAQAQTATARTVAELGRLDILVNNAGVMLLAADDIADAIGYIVMRPRRVAVNELLIRPTEQAD